ncbi:hypothetical protein B9Z55_003126 [Caenorhabditis nigoni]|uniref:Uncharacterized protein n=1 Tax=Caenorhabditis nigoni TaxID=1611254 RepID=A0A2G5VNN6_9PELO|nr:hypothetical protein B9Z55_003126 [Caenorhabditis nigoni]
MLFIEKIIISIIEIQTFQINQFFPIAPSSTFYNRITTMLKPKDYNKMFVELEDSDDVIIVDSLAAIIHRNFKGNPLLKKWRTSKPGQGAALLLKEDSTC